MMDVNKILSADLLDIVFDGRNKEYGAYELRRSYNKRLLIALVAMAALSALIFISALVADQVKDEKKDLVNVDDVQLSDVQKNEPPPPPPPPPPPKPPEPPKIEIAKFTPPKIVKDEEVKEDEKPPEIEKIEEAKLVSSIRKVLRMRAW